MIGPRSGVTLGGLRSYGQYCPVARGAEVFATRWTPVIVRNLLLGCRTYGELAAGAPGIPRAVLSERLRQLEVRGLITRRPNPRGRGSLYEPTEACEDLRPVCDALGAWGAKWVEIAPEHLDPYAALWGMCRGIGYLPLPERRVTIRFEMRDTPRGPRRLWRSYTDRSPRSAFGRRGSRRTSSSRPIPPGWSDGCSDKPRSDTA